VWSNDSESYADCSVGAGKASYARQVKDNDLGKKEYPRLPGWGLAVGLTTPLQKNVLWWEASKLEGEAKVRQGL